MRLVSAVAHLLQAKALCSGQLAEQILLCMIPSSSCAGGTQATPSQMSRYSGALDHGTVPLVVALGLLVGMMSVACC